MPDARAVRSTASPLEALRSPAAGEPVVAFDLGATYLRVAIVGDRPSEVRSYPTATLRRSASEGIVPGIVETILAEVRERGVVPAAIGGGVAAYVSRDGSILGDRPFGLLAGGALRDRLVEASGICVALDNDANLAAVAEIEMGAGRGLSDAAVVTLGTNVGLGIVANGQIVRGAHGAAGEAGDLLVPARRGRGGRDLEAWAGRLGHGTTRGPDHYALLEDLVGGGALLRSARRPGRRTSSSPSGDAIAAPSAGIFSMAAAGDRRAAAAIRHGIEGWAMLVADLVALLDPQAVVLSGGLAEEAPAFIDPLRRRAAQLCSFQPDIRVGELGAQAGLAGAVIVARSARTAGGWTAAPATASDPAASRRGSGLSASRGEVGA